MTAYQSQHQWLVTCDFPGYTNGAQTFAQMDGVDKTAQVSDVWDGGNSTPDLLTATSVLGTGSVQRPWYNARDLPLFKFLDPKVGMLFFTIKVQPTDPNMLVESGGFSYRALLTGVTSPSVQAGSQTSPAMMVVNFRAQTRSLL